MLELTTRPTDAPARDRAVSSNINFVLALTIMTLLVSGLALSSGQVISDERNRVIRAQLEVVGERLASDLVSADQLARRSGSDTTLRTTSDLPDQIVSQSYTVTVRNPDTNEYALDMISGTTNVTVPLYARTTIATGETPGGEIEIVYTGTQLELNHA